MDDLFGPGDSDFASIFPSVAQAIKEEEERLEAERMLKLLDELDRRIDAQDEINGKQKQKRVPLPPQPERHVAIDSEGRIRRSEDPPRKKVSTLDDLPRESEWEAIFGKEKEPEPLIEVKEGMRLKDKKKVYLAKINSDHESSTVSWSGPSFDSLMGLLGIVGLLLLIIAFIQSITRRNRQVQKETHPYMEMSVMDPEREAFIRQIIRSELLKMNMEAR